jgi:hypothetical protein
MAADTTSDAVRARATLDFELLEARSDFFDIVRIEGLLDKLNRDTSYVTKLLHSLSIY